MSGTLLAPTIVVAPREQEPTVKVVLAYAVLVAVALGGTAVVLAHAQRGPTLVSARVRQTRTDALVLSAAVDLYLAEYAECPDVQDLVAVGLLDPTRPLLDAWGSPFEVICARDRALVMSPGADRGYGNADDIHAGSLLRPMR